MPAYAIGQLFIKNKDWLEEYSSKIGPLLKKHQGHVIAKGKPSQLEGKAELPQVLITIEFPNLRLAHAWYDDPANQSLVKLRQTGSHFELLLVDGKEKRKRG